MRFSTASSSRPEEFHLQALPEPCMTLSSHTAPDVRPLLGTALPRPRAPPVSYYYREYSRLCDNSWTRLVNYRLRWSRIKSSRSAERPAPLPGGRLPDGNQSPLGFRPLSVGARSSRKRSRSSVSGTV